MQLILAPGGQEHRHALRSGDDSASRRAAQLLSKSVVPRPGRLESMYVICVLIYMSSAFLGLFTMPEGAPGGSDVGQLFLQALIYLTLSILIRRHWRSFARGLTDCKWVIALVGLALTSALWAADPLFVIRRGLVAAATTMFGIYFGTRYRREEQVNHLCWALAAIGAMSILMVALFRKYGIDPDFEGSLWRGVFENKNAFGKVMLLGAAAWCCSPRKSLGGRALRLAVLVGFGALIVLSGSATAVITGAVLLLLTFMYRFLRSRPTALISIIMMTLAVFTVLVPVVSDHEDTLLALLGRDSTLTGRDALWDEVLVAIGERPLLGYGFNSFWRGKTVQSEAVVSAIGWAAPTAHNGFLEICLDLGVVGLLTFGIGFALRFRTAISEFRGLGDRAAMWPLAFLSLLLLYNLTESNLLRENSLYWALYTASLVREVRAVERRGTEAGMATHDGVDAEGYPDWR
jgi:exopolysaccharide production protein ExoQ